jgi:hypothetical protein
VCVCVCVHLMKRRLPEVKKLRNLRVYTAGGTREQADSRKSVGEVLVRVGRRY